MESSVTNPDNKDVERRLQQLAEDVMSEILDIDPAHSKELLGSFVSELFLAVAKQDQQEFRRQRQAEGIAAAKAKGVRFGPARKPLPDNFNECYHAWQNGQMTAVQAAAACGMSRQAFFRARTRVEQTGQYVT